MTAPDVEAIVAVHDLRRPIARCVRSLLDSESELAARGATLRVSVIVHNTEAEAIREALGSDLARHVRIAELRDGIRSPAGPFNLGIAQAEGKYVSTVGSDDVLEPGALAAWHARARAVRADAVIASLRTSEGVVTTPYLRPGRREYLEPVPDRLAYRTAPLGLLRRTRLEEIGFRYTEGGHLNGEDIEPGLRLWFRGGRITYPYGAPCYRVMDDMGSSRATAALGALSRELGFLPALLDQDWLRTSRPTERRAIATKLARAQVSGALRRRVAALHWNVDDSAFLVQALAGLRALAGSLDQLASAEERFLDDAAEATDAASLAAAHERLRFANPLHRVVPSRPFALLGREARPRLFVSQQIAQRTGTFAHPNAMR